MIIALMNSFFAELKRRSVFRVTAAYLVVGWLTLQVSDILLDFAGAPEWVGKAIIAMLLLGLVITVILAWLFEVTEDGIQRDAGTTNAGDEIRSQRLNKLTIAAALMVAAIFVWRQTRPTVEPVAVPQTASETQEAPAPEVIPDASIAVLPFVDLSPDGDRSISLTASPKRFSTFSLR